MICSGFVRWYADAAGRAGLRVALREPRRRRDGEALPYEVRRKRVRRLARPDAAAARDDELCQRAPSPRRRLPDARPRGEPPDPRGGGGGAPGDAGDCGEVDNREWRDPFDPALRIDCSDGSMFSGSDSAWPRRSGGSAMATVSGMCLEKSDDERRPLDSRTATRRADPQKLKTQTKADFDGLTSSDGGGTMVSSRMK